MTKLLEEAIDRLRRLPAPIQDCAARAVILQLEEEPEPDDFEEGQRELANEGYITFDALIGVGSRRPSQAFDLSSDGNLGRLFTAFEA